MGICNCDLYYVNVTAVKSQLYILSCSTNISDQHACGSVLVIDDSGNVCWWCLSYLNGWYEHITLLSHLLAYCMAYCNTMPSCQICKIILGTTWGAMSMTSIFYHMPKLKEMLFYMANFLQILFFSDANDREVIIIKLVHICISAMACANSYRDLKIRLMRHSSR